MGMPVWLQIVMPILLSGNIAVGLKIIFAAGKLVQQVEDMSERLARTDERVANLEERWMNMWSSRPASQ